MKHEYHEGPKAVENFEKLTRAVFKTPKAVNPQRQLKPNGKRQGKSTF